MRQASTELKRFLFKNLYRHPAVQAQRDRAEQVLRELFQIYLTDPGRLPPDFADGEDHTRACADYIAGMTDRFALREHERLTGKRLIAA
jgi:dGTPase